MCAFSTTRYKMPVPEKNPVVRGRRCRYTTTAHNDDRDKTRSKTKRGEMLQSVLVPILKVLRLFVPRNGTVIVMPNTGAGSFGDQAMMDVATNQVASRGYIPVIFEVPGELYHLRTQVRSLVLGKGKLTQFAQILWALARAEGIALIAADVINDKYHGTRRRLDVVDTGARVGMPAALLGYSLTDNPGPVSTSQLRNLSPGVTSYLRDRLSHERYVSLTGKQAPLVADIAFMLAPETDTSVGRATLEQIATWKSEGCMVLGVNVGGPTIAAMKDDGVPAYTRLLTRWLEADPARRIVLVPHDTKPKPHGDLPYAEELMEVLAPQFGDRIHMMRPPFNTWEIKQVAGALDAVLTARMHFAIACLGMGTPPLCVAYLGKFEGLMEHFDLPDVLVEPEDVPNTEVMFDHLSRFIALNTDLRTRIAQAWPQVKSLSRQNFDWLPKRKD